MSTPDLSFVDPDRRAEVARRIRVVERFMKAPGRRSAEQHAAELGMGVTQFYRLVRIWTERRQPQELAGATRRRPGYRHAKGLDDAQLALVRGTEAGMPDDTVLERVLDEIYRHASAMGANLPSRPTVRAAAAAARRSRLADRPAGIGLAIDHCAVDLSVAWHGAPVAPVATLLLDLERRDVIGAALDPVGGSWRSTAWAVLDALDRTTARSAIAADAAPIPVELDIDAAAGWTGLIDAMDRHHLARSGRDLSRLPGGKRTIALLGKDVNGIRFRSRATHRKPEERPGVGGVIDLGEAQDHVRARLVGDRAENALSRLAGSAHGALAQEIRSLLAS